MKDRKFYEVTTLETSFALLYEAAKDVRSTKDRGTTVIK